MSVKNWSEKRNFGIFRPRFSQTLKEIPTFKVGYLREKMKILKNAWKFFEPFSENCVGEKYENFIFRANFNARKHATNFAKIQTI